MKNLLKKPKKKLKKTQSMRLINKELSRTNKTLIELLIGILTLWIKWKDKENNVYMKIIKFLLVWNRVLQ